MRERTTDEGIATDLARIEAWQLRLGSLPGAALDPWRAASAQAWLERARVEYTDNDETAFAGAALATAATLLDSISAGAAGVKSGHVPPTRVLPGSSKVHDDLWRSLDRMKADPGFDCAAVPLAQLEVALAAAGNEALDQGDCTTSPILADAERLAADAKAREAGCPGPTPPAATAPAPPVPQPPAPPAPPVVSSEELPALRNVHFAFDRCGLGPESRRIVAAVAEVLRQHPGVRLRIEGHTDVRGTSAYNLGLSACRICSVRSLLESLGVSSARMTADPQGKSRPFTPQHSPRAHALNRRVELILVDELGREIPASPQERDLQLEHWKPGGVRTHRPEAADFPSTRGTECTLP